MTRWIERGLVLAAAVSMVSAQALAEAPASKYPVKLANGFQVHRGSEPGTETCVLYGLRAMPTAGKETGPLIVSAEAHWGAKGESMGYGELSVQPVETSVTNSQNQDVKVRLDVDGSAFDVPYGEVHKAVVTFLTIRFPVETLNRIFNGKALKIFLIDGKTNEAKLFATADLSKGKEAFTEFGRCVGVLPDIPSELAGGWKLVRDPDGCFIQDDDLALARDSHGRAAVVLSQEKPEQFSKDTKMTIGGKPVKFGYDRTEKDGITDQIFSFAATDLDRVSVEAPLVISDGDDTIIDSAREFPTVNLLYLKKCAAPLQKPAKPAK